MSRLVSPEILDHLPADAAEAQQSRRDLRWINRCMGNHRWFRRTLATTLRPDDRVLELGAGEGELRRLAPPTAAWDAIDLAPRPAGWPARARWHRADLRTFEGWADYTVIVGNLVFHHFEAGALAALGAHVREHARLMLASEPARHWRARAGFALFCPLIRANAVTRHDGRVSIEAGFRGCELASALRLDPKRWHCRFPAGRLGAYRLVASRRT